MTRPSFSLSSSPSSACQEHSMRYSRSPTPAEVFVEMKLLLEFSDLHIGESCACADLLPAESVDNVKNVQTLCNHYYPEYSFSSNCI